MKEQEANMREIPPPETRGTGLILDIEGKKVFIPMSKKQVMEHLRWSRKVGENDKDFADRLEQMRRETLMEALFGLDDAMREKGMEGLGSLFKESKSSKMD